MSLPAPVARLRRPFLLASLVLHMALAAGLYYFGSYQIDLQRQNEQVASSMRATSAARSARRVEDLQKIKQLLEESATRAAKQDAAAPPAPKPVSSDPEEQLAQARELAKSIEEISRDIKAEELAALTGKPKEQARAEVDAAMPAPPEPPAGNPAEAIASLETEARKVLAERAAQLQRRQEGVQVGGGEEPGPASGQGEAGGAAGGTAGDHPGSGGGTMNQQIAAFMQDGAEPERSGPSQRYRGNEQAFFDTGVGYIPDVNPRTMIKARGRMLGPGGQYANRIYLNSWYLIGPFEGRHGIGLFNNPKYPPEDAVLLDAVYRGKEGRFLRWEYVSEPTYPLIPRDQAEDAVYYGYTEVLMDQERDLMMWIGADDNAQVTLNGRMVWKGGNVNKQWFWNTLYGGRNWLVRDFNRTEAKQLVHFKKGRNTVFFKLSNGPTRLFFSMVLTLPNER